MATVLVVDDLAAQRQLVAGLLNRQKRYELAFAGNGKEALAKLKEQPVELVVTDLLMPEMDGLELLRAIRRDHPTLPVILMTASGSEQLAVQALQEGAASYVPKRVLARRLADTVASVLSASRKERTHAQLGKRVAAQELTFELENDADLLLALPYFLKPHLMAAGLTDHLALVRTHMVLEEALVNALYHGNLEVGADLREKSPDEFFAVAERRAQDSPYRERRIHVNVRLPTAEQAELTIRDVGPGFDRGRCRARQTSPLWMGASGRGVMLMHVHGRSPLQRLRQRRHHVQPESAQRKRWLILWGRFLTGRCLAG